MTYPTPGGVKKDLEKVVGSLEMLKRVQGALLKHVLWRMKKGMSIGNSSLFRSIFVVIGAIIIVNMCGVIIGAMVQLIKIAPGGDEGQEGEIWVNELIHKEVEIWE